MNRILVVYCSRTGNTERVARRIAAQCGADIEEIKDTVGRSGPLGYLRSALEALLGHEPRIRRTHYAPKLYDVVIVGTPIWFWNMSSPVRRYVHEHRDELRQVAFFCTFGGSGQEKVLNELALLCGKTPVATLALTERQVETHKDAAALSRFVAEVKQARGGAFMPGQALAA